MQTLALPHLAADVGSLPPEGPGRDRRLGRLVDAHAASEAARALTEAAVNPREEGIAAAALAAAAAVVGGDDAARDALGGIVATPEFLALVPEWVRELRAAASACPDTGACTVASALELWSWTMKHVRKGEGAGAGAAARAVDELAGAVAPLLAARSLALEVTAPATGGEASLRRDLCHAHAARTAASVGAICAEIVFGYRRHLGWDEEGCATCWGGDQLDALEAVIPGIAVGARMRSDVIEADGSHPAKEGPCARFDGVDGFVRLRDRLDGCLTGARIARDRAAAAIADSLTTTINETKGKR